MSSHSSNNYRKKERKNEPLIALGPHHGGGGGGLNSCISDTPPLGGEGARFEHPRLPKVVPNCLVAQCVVGHILLPQTRMWGERERGGGQRGERETERCGGERQRQREGSLEVRAHIACNDQGSYVGQPKSPVTSETETSEHTSTKLVQADRVHPSTGHTHL